MTRCGHMPWRWTNLSAITPGVWRRLTPERPLCKSTRSAVLLLLLVVLVLVLSCAIIIMFNYWIFSRMFKKLIQETNFWGASGHVHFKSADRQSNILIKQNFATHSVVVGQFIPTIDSKSSRRGQLKLNPSLITWATKQIPRDSLPGQ